MPKVCAGNRFAFLAHLLDRRCDRAKGRTPSEHQDLAVGIAVYLEWRNIRDRAIDLLLTQFDHQVMVLRIVIDVAGDVLLFDATDAVLKSGRAGQRPGTRQSLFVARVRHEVLRIGCELHFDAWQLLDCRHRPGFGAVGEIAVRQIENRNHVFEGEPHRLDGHVEAVGGR